MLGKTTIGGILVVVTMLPRFAQGQACCATGTGLSPARLGLHDNYGLGWTLRSQSGVGRHDETGRYSGAATDTRELGFAEDLFGAFRWFERGQLAALVPFVQTYRRSHRQVSTGGGLGDVNLNARYDFIWGSRYRYVPGVAVLVGMTLPTGTPAETASRPLATDATGRGLLQVSVGIAVEKTVGPTVTTATGLLAWRKTAAFHGVSVDVAPELRTLVSLAYVLPGEQSFGVFAAFATEGNARLNGVVVTSSARREVQFGMFAGMPMGESFRLRFGFALNPPSDGFGRNQPAIVSSFVGASWSSS